VEHPVTEMITGLDLVEWQLKVGAGQTLPLAQEQIVLRGHALEARIYAEDADKGFLPSTGRVVHFAAPDETPFVRVDAGVEAGDEISPHYDPMIAKLIVWDDGEDGNDAASRARACARMLKALAEVELVGVTSNVGFLSRLIASPAFSQADLDTGLIAREEAYLFPEPAEPPAEVWLSVALAELLRAQKSALAVAGMSQDAHSPWHVHDGWRVVGRAQQVVHLRCGEVEKKIMAAVEPPHQTGRFLMRCDDQIVSAAGQLEAAVILHADFGGRRLTATVIPVAEKRHVFMPGAAHSMRHVLTLIDPLHHAGQEGSSEGSVLAPMPGKVIAWLAAAGDAVAKGAPLLILEAMKMEHTIRAPAAGVVRAFHFAVGEQVAEGAELLDFVAP
jgi:3-methylcrotonyl-CoA carboxylase alpha subunit